MILDEYLNYLQEDDDEEIEEKFAIVKKLAKLAKDPLGKKRHLTAVRRHRKKVAKLKQTIKPKATLIKKIPKQYRKKQYTALRKTKQLASAKRTGKELKRAEKAMKWKKRARTSVALSGVGGAGFYAAKRADLKGQSI